MESNTGESAINIAITNQRDTITHLITILSNPHLDPEQMSAQISTAEEHLRRAIMEPYSKAIAIQLEKIRKLYESYKKQVLPLKPRCVALGSAPEIRAIEVILKDVASKRTRGREVKARNRWDQEWEEGVTGLIEAFNRLKDLEATLEECIIRATQIKSSKKQIALAWWGIVATAVAAILAIILVS